MTTPTSQAGGLSAKGAKRVEYAIIALCCAALFMIFQPFTIDLFTVGCILVVVGGLAFNLVPLCRPGVQPRSLFKAGGIILLILVIVAMLGIGSAELYVYRLEAASAAREAQQ
ncbi:hypothetical protein [Geminicoccus roseus]|uniref:hypothetical protein n=1 Tax=Geminicoccus roseus TaxID=404900 RepID=UPI00042577EF|nr:hypothetical protein [Geminicoccus roseus]